MPSMSSGTGWSRTSSRRRTRTRPSNRSSERVDEKFSVRRAVQALSGRPERLWPAGAIHHGARILFLVALAILTHALFPVAPVPDFPVLEKGMVAEEDIIAEVGFPIYKSEEELARERAEAAASVPPIFEYSPAAVDTMLARLTGFFARADSIVA